MHQAFKHLAKRVAEVQEALRQVTREVESQSERETKVLEQVAYGKTFDEGLAPFQEEVVAQIQQSLEALDRAHDELSTAHTVLSDLAHQ